MKNIPKIPLQQTEAWQNLQHDLGETTFFLSDYSETIDSKEQKTRTTNLEQQNTETTSNAPVNYQMLIIKKSTPVGPYFYLPYGPYLRQKSAAKSAYEALNALEKQENVVFTRIEPEAPEIASYWLEKSRPSKDLSPKETWVLDLAPSLDELYKNMKQNTRNLAKNYQKKGISVEKVAKSPENLEIFYGFLTRVAKHNHFNPIEEKTFTAEVNQPFASLFIAYYQPEEAPKGASEEASEKAPEKTIATPSKTAKTTAKIKNPQKIPIAASLFFDDDTTRYYMQSGTDPDYRKLPGTISILAEAIKEAKRKNLQFFDFWGIAPEGAEKNHPWAGFTKFKKSFGGREVAYAGTHDLVRSPLRYRLYKILRRLNLLRRKIRASLR